MYNIFVQMAPNPLNTAAAAGGLAPGYMPYTYAAGAYGTSPYAPGMPYGPFPSTAGLNGTFPPGPVPYSAFPSAPGPCGAFPYIMPGRNL